MGVYRNAAVCMRGHVYSKDTGYSPPAARCAECGARVITACPGCSTPLRGRYHVDGVIGFSGNYEPPAFCFACGAPLPWAPREARIWELQNLLDEESLSDADRLVASEQLVALQNPDLGEDEQVERWNRVKKLAPGLMASGHRIIETVVTAAVKAQLGL